MQIPVNIKKKHLLQAIQKIDAEGVPTDADSQYYDVVYNEKRYPPKLIVSYANLFANNTVLDRGLFKGGIGTRCFKLLEDNGFIIDNKPGTNANPTNIWIEKTYLKNREDRLEGDRALGKALWSPQKGKNGSDIYKNMTKVKAGDIVLHLIDNQEISSVSIVKNTAVEINGLEGTDWDGPDAYLIELTDHTNLTNVIDKSDILSEINKPILFEIRENSEVFYNRDLKLREGAYLTPCPLELYSLINDIYKKKSNTNLPFYDRLGKNVPKPTPKSNNIMNPLNLKTIIEKLSNTGLQFDERLIIRFVASLLTKPFVILTGLSGSGKTKLAHAFAKGITNDDTQYCIVPVGADWTNKEFLLGFPNALDDLNYMLPDNGALNLILEAINTENKNKPYFLILDEMNLSHVERYFADFLSLMESKDSLKLYKGNVRTSSDGIVVHDKN